jgi:hypothetical protein
LGGGINHTVNPLHNQPPYIKEKSFKPGHFIAINVGSTMRTCSECETYNYTSVVKEVQCGALCYCCHVQMICLESQSQLSPTHDFKSSICNLSYVSQHAKFQCWVYRLRQPRFQAPSSNPQPKGTLIQFVVTQEVIICPEGKVKVKFILCLIN